MRTTAKMVRFWANLVPSRAKCTPALAACLIMAAIPGFAPKIDAQQPAGFFQGKPGSFLGLPASGCFVQSLEEFVDGQRATAGLFWTSSVVWHNGKLLLSDEWRSSLVEVRPGQTVDFHAKFPYTREEAEVIEREAEELSLGVRMPKSVSQHGDGFLLIMWEQGESGPVNWLLFVNADGKIKKAIKPTQRLTKDFKVVNTNAHLAVPMDQGAFIVSDMYPVQQGREAYKTAFSYISKDEFEPFDIGLRGDLAMKSLKRLFYARGDLALLATRKGEKREGEEQREPDTAYVLVMEEHPWIGQVQRGDSEISMLVDLSSEYSIPFIAVENPTSDEAARYFQHVHHTIEQSAMPYSLFVWRNRLFMVAKSAAGDGGYTEWHAREVHETGELGARIVLPVTREAVSFTSGDAPFIAAVARGAVQINRGGDLREFLHRSTLSVTAFPGSLLDHGDDSVSIPFKARDCRQIPVR